MPERPLIPRVSGTQSWAIRRITSTNATVTMAKYTPRSLSDGYKKHGLKMLDHHATWPDGSVSTEAGIEEIDEREKTGRLKYAAHLSDLLEERRFYHRKDGKIVKMKDDIMSALRICIMARRFARAVPLGAVDNRPPDERGGLAANVDFDLF